jgi:molybdopterin molybdotransferase
MAVDSSTQRIARLTPLATVRSLIETRVDPVAPRARPAASACGRVLAAEVTASKLPPVPIALRDGFAVAAGAIADAGPYAPALFAAPPRRVDAGEPLPEGMDAVLPLDAIQEHAGRAAAIAPISPGEGVLAAGGDASSGAILRKAGTQLRASDVAVLTAAGIADVAVRDPRLRMACGTHPKTPVVEAAADMLAHVVVAAGGTVLESNGEPERLYETLAEARADAGLVIGGTGSGRGDASVRTFARFGRIEAHGVGIAPGETVAFGFVDTRPVLFIPGRLDSALAAWLFIGRHMIAKLTGNRVEDAGKELPLRRKVASTIGLVELIPVRCVDGMADPLGSGYLSFESLAGSDGWISVPAESEGFAAGTQVAVRPWP